MKAHELLSDETKWTKRAFAKTKKGKVVMTSNRYAYCFCVTGALYRVYKGQGFTDAYSRLRKALNLRTRDVCNWNDDPRRTFAEVRALLVKLDI